MSRLDVVFVIVTAAVLLGVYELGWGAYLLKLQFVALLICYFIGKWVRGRELARSAVPQTRAEGADG